jgi:hypothetical protein
MPSFASYSHLYAAKGGVVIDGEVYTTSGTGALQKVAVIPSSYTAFRAVPVRSGVGVWSVTMRDPAFRVLLAEVRPFTTTANTVGVVMQATTLDSGGRLVINWTFCTIGTATPVDIATAQKFGVTVVYSETSIA